MVHCSKLGKMTHDSKARTHLVVFVIRLALRAYTDNNSQISRYIIHTRFVCISALKSSAVGGHRDVNTSHELQQINETPFVPLQ